MAPLSVSARNSVERLQFGASLGGGRSGYDIPLKGIKSRGYEKPPLPSKAGLDTSLNLANVSVGKIHPGALPSAFRSTGVTSRTVRGTQRTLRVQQDFDTLATFLRREKDFAHQRKSTCKYPWCGDGPSAESKTSGSSVLDLKIQPLDGYVAWEQAMQEHLSTRRRVLLDTSLSASKSLSMPLPDSHFPVQQKPVSIGCSFMP
jgi:hypothetical protein